MTAAAPFAVRGDWHRLEWTAPLAALPFAAAIALAPVASAPVWAAAAGLAALVAWVAVQDARHYTISDAALVAAALIALAFRWWAARVDGEAAGAAVLAMALDVAMCGGLLLAFREGYYRLKGVDGLGFGDVKLGAIGALAVGGTGFAWSLLAASATGLAIVALRRRLRPTAAPLDRLPFGTLLAPAFFAVWFVAEALPRLAGS